MRKRGHPRHLRGLCPEQLEGCSGYLLTWAWLWETQLSQGRQQFVLDVLAPSKEKCEVRPCMDQSRVQGGALELLVMNASPSYVTINFSKAAFVSSSPTATTPMLCPNKCTINTYLVNILQE